MHVHFIGVAGRGMGALAITLAHGGHVVTGSDAETYEPMRGQLAAAGIDVMPFDAMNVRARLDAVVAGRRIPAENVELQEARQRGLPTQSFPEFLRHHFLSRSRNIVVAGGVGKTTTTAMVTWIFEHAGLAPDYLVGGVAHNLPQPARLSGSAITVLEGDEYATGPDDASPKFMHYPPEIVVVTNLIGDHPDLYPDDDRLFEAFAALVRTIPASGRLVLPSGDARVAALADHASCPVTCVGDDPAATVRLTNVTTTPHGVRLQVDGQVVDVCMPGTMNAGNAALAMAAAAHMGVGFEAATRALGAFRGLVDHQEARVAGRCIIVRDKASHPVSIAGLAEALRHSFPGRRLLVALQPRATGGRQWTYQRDLPAALAQFDHVILAPPYEHRPPAHTPWHDTPFDWSLLCDEVSRRGASVTRADVIASLPSAITTTARDGDVVLVLVREQFVHVIGDVEHALRQR